MNATNLKYIFILLGGLLWSVGAVAHVSQQGLVLLLPTRFYMFSGVMVVVLTLAIVVWSPHKVSSKWFASKRLWTTRHHKLKELCSVLSTCLLFFLLYLGFTASNDPLENPLPLFIWTVWWVGFVVVQGFLGDLWGWVNPWTGVAAFIRKSGWTARLALPQALHQWPAVVIFLLFISFALADTTPEAPARLAIIVSGYWCFTMVAVLLFGRSWLVQGECFSIMLARFAQLAPLARCGDALRVGVPGWKLLRSQANSVSAAVFILVLLGCGSFDGLNETFLWLAAIGVNPLAFPGRSSIVVETIAGLLLANAALIVVYALCIYAGLKIASRRITSRYNTVHNNDHVDGPVTQASSVTFNRAFCAFAIALLPIAFAYHFAHFLTSFMVNIQYTFAAVSDPFGNGADFLNLGSFYVTTGFFNTPHSVKMIWLSQAGAVVVGHVLSVLIAHAVALELFGSARRAIVSQVPLAVFMVGYTFIGLWLLASPKGA